MVKKRVYVVFSNTSRSSAEIVGGYSSYRVQNWGVFSSLQDAYDEAQRVVNIEVDGFAFLLPLERVSEELSSVDFASSSSAIVYSHSSDRDSFFGVGGTEFKVGIQVFTLDEVLT